MHSPSFFLLSLFTVSHGMSSNVCHDKSGIFLLICRPRSLQLSHLSHQVLQALFRLFHHLPVTLILYPTKKQNQKVITFLTPSVIVGWELTAIGMVYATVMPSGRSATAAAVACVSSLASSDTSSIPHSLSSCSTSSSSSTWIASFFGRAASCAWRGDTFASRVPC